MKEQDLRDGRLDSQRGFTLVELLAVMTTMGVLAGIVVPAVSGTKEASNEAEIQEVRHEAITQEAGSRIQGQGSSGCSSRRLDGLGVS